MSWYEFLVFGFLETHDFKTNCVNDDVIALIVFGVKAGQSSSILFKRKVKLDMFSL